MEKQANIIIVGAGFAGVRAALNLEVRRMPNVIITLISETSHFEYHPALYRVVTGRSPFEACVPLREIFEHKRVKLVEDAIAGANLKERTLMGASGSRYRFDFLILALGSETVYFGIPGLKERSFEFKSIAEALRLKTHLREVFRACEQVSAEEKVCAAHIVVVGGGASGTELAGELASYTKILARIYGLAPSLVTIDLIEAAPRLLPALPEDISARAEKRLHTLGVNIFLNRAVIREEIEKLFLKDMELKTETVIWTAGAKPNHFYSEIQGLSIDAKGRVLVNEFLEANGWQNVFVAGDAAATPYAGMAQTAIQDGAYLAELIAQKISGTPLAPYIPKKPLYAIPIGARWAIVLLGSLRIYGRVGWWLRRIADFRFFLSILPFRKALRAFQTNKALCKSCSICLSNE